MNEDKSQKSALNKLRHDLKNSLTVIKLNLLFIKKDPEKKDLYLGKIEERVDRIIEDLKNY